MLRNVLAVIVGFVVGGIVNSSLIAAGSALVAPPPGVDVNSLEGLRSAIHQFQPRHFVTPFLAHALGTFAGVLVAYLIARTPRAQTAYLLGVLFLCGGIAASVMIPAPAWFIALDLVLAYLPMAWLAVRIGARMNAA